MDDKDEKKPLPEEDRKKNFEANFCIGTGVGLGALGAGVTAVTGAVCPLCVVAVPLLIGTGVVSRIKNKKRKAHK